MKYIYCLAVASLGILNIQCEAQKTTNPTKIATINSFNNSDIQKVELEEITRGNRRSAQITSGMKTVELNGTSTQTKIQPAEWNLLKKTTTDISLEKLNSYPSPTTDRYHDGALISTIRITTSTGKVYESQSFDSGKPPKELASIYKILSSDFSRK